MIIKIHDNKEIIKKSYLLFNNEYATAANTNGDLKSSRLEWTIAVSAGNGLCVCAFVCAFVLCVCLFYLFVQRWLFGANLLLVWILISIISYNNILYVI